MNTKPLISFVIPVYNCEKYLHQCLESLINQSESNFEVICVDDGSKDNSKEIIRNFIHKDPRFTLVEQENSGPAYARNKGLEFTKGQYIWWIDADDWIELNSIKKINQSIQSSGADVIGFASKVFNNKTQKFKNLDSYRDLQKIPSTFLNRNFSPYEGRSFLFDLPLEAWSRVYKKEFILENQIKFDTSLRLLDDSLFVNETFLKAHKIYYIVDVLYNYRSFNPTSLVSSHKYSDERYFRSPIYLAQKCDEILKQKNYLVEDYSSMIFRNLDRIINLLPRMNNKFKKKYFIEFQNYLINSKLNESPSISTHPIFNFLQLVKNNSYFIYQLKTFFYLRVQTGRHDRVSLFKLKIYKKSIN